MRTFVAALIVVSLTAASSNAETKTTTSTLQYESINVTELWSYTQEYLDSLRSRNDVADNSVVFRLWTDNGTWIGCRLQLRAFSNESHVGSMEFPKLQEYICEKEVYKMRTAQPNSVYEDRVLLENPTQVELSAAGSVSTYVRRLCVGFYSEVGDFDSSASYRAFCINNQLLKDCKQLTNRWGWVTLTKNETIILNEDININTLGKIIFRDIDSLITSMERLAQDKHDSDAKWDVCNRIDLIKGTSQSWDLSCYAEKTDTQYELSTYFNVPYDTTVISTRLVNPSECSIVKPL